MSNQTFINKWKDVSSQIGLQKNYESPKDPAFVPKEYDGILQHLTVLYVQYIKIFQKLAVTHDQMLHPQKRRLLRDVMMATMGRIIEIKAQMVEVDANDFPDLEACLFDLKLVPEDISMPIPTFLAEERAEAIEKREEELIQKEAKEFKLENKVAFPALTLEEAILIIQRNERGRQGQMRAKYMKDLRNQEEQDADLVGIRDKQQIEAAVIRIQKSYDNIYWEPHMTMIF